MRAHAGEREVVGDHISEAGFDEDTSVLGQAGETVRGHGLCKACSLDCTQVVSPNPVGEYDLPSHHQHTVAFAEQAVLVRDVKEGLLTDAGAEACIGKWQARDISMHEPDVCRQTHQLSQVHGGSNPREP